MAKRTMGKSSIIGMTGGVLIGAAVLLFVVVMMINNLKSVNSFGPVDKLPAYSAATNASHMVNLREWNASNATLEQLKTFLTICTILLGILGIVLIGSTIIGAIGGGFGG